MILKNKMKQFRKNKMKCNFSCLVEFLKIKYYIYQQRTYLGSTCGAKIQKINIKNWIKNKKNS